MYKYNIYARSNANLLALVRTLALSSRRFAAKSNCAMRESVKIVCIAASLSVFTLPIYSRCRC